ncbi:MAG TPA: hypothetical protein VKM55_22805 [Candidatus Lokiarchaeia archaeon]|nr:hypothetical protein [Candidatus Lokiarchaeia archaeon]
MDEKNLHRWLWLGGLFPLGNLLVLVGTLDTSIVDIVQSLFLIFPIIANVILLAAGVFLKQRGIKGWAIAGLGVSILPIIIIVSIYDQLTSRGITSMLISMLFGMAFILVDSVAIGFLARRIGNKILLITAVIIALLGVLQVSGILLWFNVAASVVYILALSPRSLAHEWTARAVPRKMKEILGIVTIGSLTCLALVPYLVVSTADELAQPHFITANFTDLSKIANISRFRSQAGHSYVDSFEPTAPYSMKHYFWPKTPYKNSSSAIEIYAPADAIIMNIAWESHEMMPGKLRGFQVHLCPVGAPEYRITLFHVNITSGLFPGMYVKAGQLLGHADTRNASNFDIAISLQLPFGEFRCVSYFAVMDDSVFNLFAARGVMTRQQPIITQADAVTAEGVNEPLNWSWIQLS